MTWTYNETLATAKDKVRWLVGDTDANEPLVQDEEIAFALSEEGSVYAAGATVARAIAARFARRPSTSIDGLSITMRERVEHYNRLADDLAAKATDATGGLGVPFVGGVSIDGMRTVAGDNDRTPNRLRIGMQDSPEVPVVVGSQRGGVLSDTDEQP
ncbi:MAG: hypothetical protein ACK53W_12635 [Gemmatimonadota bacterium]